jgi:Bromodomain associated
MSKTAVVPSRRGKNSITVYQQTQHLRKDDTLYCHGTARRAVARAALHLGIDCMTMESIDVLASCLLDYLERIGSAMANNAEASGRSSAYCNIFDAISAVELCTSTAAATTKSTFIPNGGLTGSHLDSMDMSSSDVEIGNGIHSNGIDSFGNGSNGTSWKDLASFCFGPNWNKHPPLITATIDSENRRGNGAFISVHTTAAGKTGPSTLALMNGSSTAPLSTENGIITTNANSGTVLSTETGWSAPYPDEVPHFPVVSRKGEVANPHPFAEPKLHRYDTAVAGSSSTELPADGVDVDESNRNLSEIPDSVFQSVLEWGTLTVSSAPLAISGEKRSLDNSNDDEMKLRPTKKVKLIDGTSTAAALSNHEQQESVAELLLLPIFYPPIPVQQKDENRVVVTEEKITSIDSSTSSCQTNSLQAVSIAAADGKSADGDHDNPNRLLVRSALVSRSMSSSGNNVHGRGSSSLYWGSSWSSATSKVDMNLVVRSGRPTVPAGGTSSSGNDGTTTSVAPLSATTAPLIVPISRASGSRVSRVLEGSMDPPVL